MNQFAVFYAATPRLLRTLLVAMAGLYVAFLVAALVASVAPGAGLLVRFFEVLALDPARVATQPWSLVTHPLVNPVLGFFGAISLLFGLSFLHLLGRDATDLLGERWFGLTCLVATLGASFLAILAAFGLGYGGRVFGPWPLVMGLAMALGIRFPGVLVFSGQGFMVRKAQAVASALELSGTRICIGADAAGVQGIADYFGTLRMPYELAKFEKWRESVLLFVCCTRRLILRRAPAGFR